MKKHINPTFRYEKSLLHEGYQLVAGVDEVGLGSVAGPVYAVAVMFDKETIEGADENTFTAKVQLKNKKKIVHVDDSKRLSSNARIALSKKLFKLCACYSFGGVSVKEINEIQNITIVGKLAMMRAVNALETQPDYVLIDGKNKLDLIDIPNKAIVKGDQKSISIASASILAKILRDKHMRNMTKMFPGYNWDKNAGYLTKAHKQAIDKHGICAYHREYMLNKK